MAQWPREASLKLKGSAASWYAARFPALPAGTCPRWSELHAAMPHAYGGLSGPPQPPAVDGSSGKEAMRGWKSTRCFSTQGGQQHGARGPDRIHPPEPVGGGRVRALDLSGQCRREHLGRGPQRVGAWRLSDAPTGCLSCPPPTREALLARRENLRDLLKEQGPATTGHGSSSARAAVSTGTGAAERPTRPGGGSSAPPWTGRPWRRASRPSIRNAATTRLVPHHGTRAQRSTRSWSATLRPSARPPGGA